MFKACILLYANIMSIAGSRNTLLGYGAALPNLAASNQIVIGTQNETTYFGGQSTIISQGSLTLSGNTSLTVSGNAGTSGQYLVSGGAVAPYWGPVLPQTLTVTGAGSTFSIAKPLSNLYTVSGDGRVDHQWALTLPAASASTGAYLCLKNMASASGTVASTIVTLGVTIAAPMITMSPGDSGQFESDGTNWYVISANQVFTSSLTPTITNLSPSEGPLAGGNTIAITGTNFTSTSTVSFGSNSGTVLSWTPTSISVTVPTGTGTVLVKVKSAAGTSNGFPYQYDPVPTFTVLTPTSGANNVSTVLTISGTGFVSGSTSVTLNSVAATNVNVDNTKTTLTATAPQSAVIGAVPLTITTPGGQVTQANAYTYFGSAQFVFTGLNQSWTVPTGVSQVTATIAGSAGATDPFYGNLGGKGAILVGTIPVTAGAVLTIICGGHPDTYSGFNQPYAGNGRVVNNGGYGGGYSAICTSAANVDSDGVPRAASTGILMLAGGGGGGGFINVPAVNFGDAGGWNSGSTPQSQGQSVTGGGGGGSTTSGTGTGGAGTPGEGTGLQFLGGTSNNAAGAGAGGLGGGGAGTNGGGGGSSYINPSVTNVNVSITNTGKGYITLTWS